MIGLTMAAWEAVEALEKRFGVVAEQKHWQDVQVPSMVIIPTGTKNRHCKAFDVNEAIRDVLKATGGNLLKVDVDPGAGEVDQTAEITIAHQNGKKIILWFYRVLSGEPKPDRIAVWDME